MPTPNPKLTEGEWAIMQVVWDLEPVPAPTVQERLQQHLGWAYSTVKTMMDRMVTKGLLKTERIRKLYLYSADITLDQARRGEMAQAIKRAFDGALTPMMQFLLDSNDLSQEQLEDLEVLIKAKRRTADEVSPSANEQ